jgi:hypothetical protein
MILNDDLRYFSPSLPVSTKVTSLEVLVMAFFCKFLFSHYDMWYFLHDKLSCFSVEVICQMNARITLVSVGEPRSLGAF